jgi:gliding motility-associated-like protein
MKSEVEKYEKIEQFLAGALSREEHRIIEELINADPNFAKEVEQHQAIINFIFDSSFAEVKEQIRTIHEDKIHSKNIRKRRLKLGLNIIIGLTLIGVLLYLILADKKEKDLISPPIRLSESIVVPGYKPNDHTDIKEEHIDSRSPESSNQSQTIPTINSFPEIAAEINQDNSLTEFQVNQLQVEDKKSNPAFTVSVTDSVLLGRKLSQRDEDDAPIPESYDCSQVNLFADIRTEKSCDNEPTGVLAIDDSSVIGGAAPYEFSIDDRASYQSESYFGNLSANQYKVWMRDKNECISFLGTFLIESIICSYNDIFAPEKGEKWEMPNREQPCRIQIYNQNGARVFEGSYDFPGRHTWDGNSINGKPLPMGTYTFLINFQDQRTFKGNVTIVR